MQTKKEINLKIINILKSKSQSQALKQLLQMQLQQKNPQIISCIRPPILYILQKAHDWESIMKCLRNWPDQINWERNFYDRMCKRIGQNTNKNLNDIDTRRQLIKLIEKKDYQHQNDRSYKQYLIQGIQKYLIKKVQTKNQRNQMKIQKKQSLPINKVQQKQKKQQPIRIKAQDQLSIRSASTNFNNRQNLKPTLRNTFYGGVPIISRFSSSLQNNNTNMNKTRLSYGFGQNIKGATKQLFEFIDKVNVNNKNNKIQNDKISIDNSEKENQIYQNNNKNQIKMVQNKKQIQTVQNKKQITIVQNNKLQIEKNQNNDNNQKFQKKKNEYLTKQQIEKQQIRKYMENNQKQRYQTSKKQNSQSNQIVRRTPRRLTPQKPLFQRRKIILKKNMNQEQQKELIDFDDKFGEDWQAFYKNRPKSKQIDDFDTQQQILPLKTERTQYGFRKSRKSNKNLEQQIQKQLNNRKQRQRQQQIQRQKIIQLQKKKKQQQMKKKKPQLLSDFQLSFISYKFNGLGKVDYVSLFNQCSKFFFRATVQEIDEQAIIFDDFVQLYRRRVKRLKNKKYKVVAQQQY